MKDETISSTAGMSLEDAESVINQIPIAKFKQNNITMN